MFSLADTCRGASVKSNIAIKRNCLRCFIFFNSYFCLLIICFRTAYERRFFFLYPSEVDAVEHEKYDIEKGEDGGKAEMFCLSHTST